MPTSTSRAGLVFILVTVFLDFVGVGLIIPVLPDMVAEVMGVTVDADPEAAAGASATPLDDAGAASARGDDDLPPEVATTYGYLVGCYALTQFLFAPVIGALADRYGRRPVLLVSIAGFAVDFLVCALTQSLWWLFAARTAAGATAASVTAVNAYVADVSSEETRTRNFGLVGATIGLGFILGPGIGGLLGEYGTRVPFFAAAGLATLNFLYGLLVLPESLTVEDRSAVQWGKANPFSSLKGLGVDKVVFGLAVCTMLAALADMSLRSTWVLFTKEKFGWGTRANGLALSTVGILMAVVQGGLAGRITGRIGRRPAIVAGLAFAAASMTGYSLAPEGWMLYPLFAVGAMAGLAYPAIQATVTSRVDRRQQGTVQGALTSLQSLAAVVAPPLATGLFAWSTDAGRSFAGSPLLAGGGLYLLAAGLAVVVTRGIADAGVGRDGYSQSPSEARHDRTDA